MTLNKNLIALTLAVGLGAFALESSQAAIYKDSGKGPRLVTASRTTSQGERLSTLEDFQNLRNGDKVAAYCPMMKKTIVTVVTNPDGKGHVKIKKTKEGMLVDGCNIVLRRKGSSKELQSLMVCPDGTLTPVECRKV